MRKILYLLFFLCIPLNVQAVEVLNENDVVTREVKGAYLKKLKVIDFEISPRFDRMNNDYTLNVPNDIESIEIEATPYYEGSRVQIIGNAHLDYGENIVTIVVSYEQDVQEYKIIVNREQIVPAFNYDAEDDETIESIYRDDSLILLISSIALFLILVLGVFIFKKKK